MAEFESWSPTLQQSSKAHKHWSGTLPSNPSFVQSEEETSPNTSKPSNSLPDEDELSILDYARHHGLCKDYTSESPLDYIQQKICMSSTEKILDDLQEPDNLFKVPEMVDFKERFEVDKDTTAILIQALSHTEQPQICDMADDDDLCLARKNGALLKLELPLLRTDPELDMLRFCKRSEPDLQNLVLLFESVDTEKDEGFDWPTSMLALPQMVMTQLACEKLQLPRNTLGYLLKLQNGDYTSRDERETVEEQLSKAKVRQE
jgi:hypothetical protein